MARIKYCTILAIIVLSTVSASQGKWKLVKQDSGISVYTRPVQGSDIDEFMGVAIIDASLDTILRVLSDIQSHTRWRANCVESRILKKIGKSSMIIYSVTKAPWPISYRDVIIRITKKTIKKNKKIIISMRSVKENLVPLRKGYVRMIDLNGEWIIEKKSKSRTKVIYNIKSNPAGNIPSSVANMASRELPYNTIKGLQKMAKLCQ